ncbi:MAG: hypothetical protein QXR60_01255 [Candidatus Nanoarchaeia archaeon]
MKKKRVDEVKKYPAKKAIPFIFSMILAIAFITYIAIYPRYDGGVGGAVVYTTGASVSLTDVQITACNSAAAYNNCNMLTDLGIVTADECCSALNLCCIDKVPIADFKAVLINAIASYFTSTPLLTLNELKDLITVYFATTGEWVDLSGIGQYSGEKLMDIYNKAKGTTTPTCYDGIQNQGETGIDCGGPCTPCTTCTPNCVGKVCGDDGCEGSCGNCPTGQVCNEDGLCIQSPCAKKGGFCGGLANVECCTNLICKLDGYYPDAGGKCIEPPSSGYNDYSLYLGSYIRTLGRNITLVNVGNKGGVLVDVDGVTKHIPYSSTVRINGVEVEVLDTFYKADKTLRYATLRVPGFFCKSESMKCLDGILYKCNNVGDWVVYKDCGGPGLCDTNGLTAKCKALNCIKEGQSLGPVVPSNTNVCCPKLTEIQALTVISTKCAPGIKCGPSSFDCQPLVGNRGYCTKCGNGICKYPENVCNCPSDCGLVTITV